MKGLGGSKCLGFSSGASVIQGVKGPTMQVIEVHEVQVKYTFGVVS